MSGRSFRHARFGIKSILALPLHNLIPHVAAMHHVAVAVMIVCQMCLVLLTHTMRSPEGARGSLVGSKEEEEEDELTFITSGTVT